MNAKLGVMALSEPSTIKDLGVNPPLVAARPLMLYVSGTGEWENGRWSFTITRRYPERPEETVGAFTIPGLVFTADAELILVGWLEEQAARKRVFFAGLTDVESTSRGRGAATPTITATAAFCAKTHD